MPYEEDLADRVRAVLATESGTSEKRMFGGLAFLLDGRMAVAASGNGGLMVRTSGDTEALLTRPGVETVEMGGRSMRTWLRVETGRLGDEATLAEWVAIGVAAARAADG